MAAAAGSRDPPSRGRDFTNEEYADILFCYGFANGVSTHARAEYQLRFPQRRLPHESVFDGAYQRLRETGSVRRRRSDSGRPRIYRTEEEEEILRHFEVDPTTSTNVVARRLGITQWKVWHTVHTGGLYPYHYTPVQVIEEGDPARRIDFCRFMLNADTEDPTYFKRILWTDESKFDQDGISNLHNIHFWAPKADRNPNKKKLKGSQRRFSLNVWMGIIDDNLVGPYFLPNNLNGEAYETFLENEVFGLLIDVPLAARRHMIYQHDGCPAHFRINVRDWLNRHFPNRWIGRGGPIPWPARSPDLTPVDYYVWGHMKSLVYDISPSPVPSIDELRRRIINAVEEIKTNLTSRVVKTELRKRMRLCIRNRGSHFENEL